MNRKLLLATVCIVAGVGVLGYGVILIVDAYASTGWPTTTGTVNSTQIVRSTGRATAGYKLRIAYSYEVDGVAYEGDRISYQDEVARSRDDAERIARRYPAGAEVMVAYDADDPSTAVLETGASGATYVLPGFGLLLIVVGTVMVVKAQLRAQ